MTRQDAANHLGVSEATVDRMVKRGKLRTEKEPQGSRYKVWVLLDDTGQTPGDKLDENSVYTVQTPAENGVHSREDGVYTGEDGLTALRTENRSLRELADYHRELLRCKSPGTIVQ